MDSSHARSDLGHGAANVSTLETQGDFVPDEIVHDDNTSPWRVNISNSSAESSDATFATPPTWSLSGLGNALRRIRNDLPRNIRSVNSQQLPVVDVTEGDECENYYSPKAQLLPRSNSESSRLDALETIDWMVTASDEQSVNRADVSSVEYTGGMRNVLTHHQLGDDVAPDDEHSTKKENTIYLPSARRSFTTIAESLLNASDGDEIELVPGVYIEHGTLEVKANNVVLRAALDGTQPQNGTVEIQLRGLLSSMVCRGKGFKATDLKFVHLAAVRTESAHAPVLPVANKAEYIPSCVNVVSGDACFERCRITSSLAHGICVWGDSTPSFKLCCIDKCMEVAVVCRGRSNPIFLSNYFRKNMCFGIAVMDACSGTFAGNFIVETVNCAVICGGSTTTAFLRNTISDGLQGPFWIQGSSRCSVIENKLRNNLKAGFQVSNYADPTVTGNTVLRGEGGGVVVHDHARGTFTQNVLEQSTRAGIGVMDRATSTFIGNTITGNAGGGAVMTGKCSPVLIGNTFTANGFVGVGVKEASKPFLSDNTIESNNGYGLLMQATSAVQLQGCRLTSNQRAGICVCDEARLVMHGCTLEPSLVAAKADEQVVGVLLHDKSTAVIQKSVLRNHKVANIVMQDFSVATLTCTELTSNGNGPIASAYGLKMSGNSCANVRHNTFSEHKEAHVMVLDYASIRASHNAMLDGHGCGVKAVCNAHCSLAHNLILGNLGTGVEVRGRGLLEMRANRLSANAQFGVLADGFVCKLKANVVFGNQLEGVHVEHSPEAIVQCNCIMRGGGVALVLVGPEKTGVDVSQFNGNLIDLDLETQRLLPRSFHEHNVTSIPSRSRELVHHNLDVLEDWAQCRSGHVVIQMPDGEYCIAAPARHDHKAFYLPAVQKPVQKAPKDRGKAKCISK